MPAHIDLSGQRFSRWKVLSSHHRRGASGTSLIYWLCTCDCGAKRLVLGDSLRGGHSRSCGCTRKGKPHPIIHGAARKGHRTPEYSIWLGVKKRCYNKNAKKYERYGGRGIGMCRRWRDSFAAFLADMGPRPSRRHSIERVNNDRGYSPGNCRWATYIEQANNRSSTRLTIKGIRRVLRLRAEGLALRAIAAEFGVSISHISYVCGRRYDELLRGPTVRRHT